MVALAIAGGVLLTVALVSDGGARQKTAASSSPGDGAGLSTAYRNAVVTICTEDREAELEFKRGIDDVQTGITSGDLSAVFSLPELMTATLVRERGLAGRLEALEGPAELEPVQLEAVATWRRKIAASEAVRARLNQAVVDSGGDALAFAPALGQLSSAEENRLEGQKDVLLRRLGGLRCEPSP